MSLETIQKGIGKNHVEKDGFAEAVYSLYEEFRDVYQREEWKRLDECERLYKGDHWHGITPASPNEPQPVTPIVFSTIENIRADLTDEFPEAVIKPEDAGAELIAKVLTEVVSQSLEAADYDQEYDKLTHDLLVGGWMVQEAGWDTELNNGLGGAFLRHVSNKNILFDPYCADFQSGRAVFKIDRLPREWFRQHYPDKYKKMQDDSDIVSEHHVDFESTVMPNENEFNILLEAWFRFFDSETGRHSVHMVKLAGGVVLEDSASIKPEGYFAHGMYPFVVTPLYEQKGSPLGLGVADMFRSAQLYSDKIDQIILKNALTAGHNRFLVMEGSCDIEDLKDYSKEVIPTTAPPGATMQWVQDRPLPSHMIAYMQQMRQSIKEESGSNDFSRGNVSSGVTAASAITALQEMSSKRSRLEGRRVHYGFKQGIRMMLETIREFDILPRQVVVTRQGEPIAIVVGPQMYREHAGGMLPIEFKVSIKPVRETRFTKLANNQMILEFSSMFQGQMDPVILMEAMDFEGQEVVLEKMRAARGQGMAALQAQVQQLTEQLEQTGRENEDLKAALVSAQNMLTVEEAEIPETLAIDQPRNTALL